MEMEQKYYCVNCGNPVKNLYKEYSATVLKLTICAKCKNVADKYVEYDLVIVIIDLILLRIMAYRHILLNYEFKNFWKLFIAIILLETYSNSALTKGLITQKLQKELNNTSYPDDELTYLDDFKFYEMGIKIAIGYSSFIIVAYTLTLIYSYLRKTDFTPIVVIWKAMTLSTMSIFLLLPSLIWETHIQEFHILFVSMYTTLSQLLAHKAVCNSEKAWSLLVIFSSHIVKIYVMNITLTELIIKIWQSRERVASIKPGHWIWDEYTDGLMFIPHGERPPPPEPMTAVSVSSVAQIRDTMFKHTFGSGSVMRFKRNYERKVKEHEVNVVILQDCKDVALYSCDVKLLTLEFITLFHTKTVDKFLRSLIIYFQHYLQIWNKLQLRRLEMGRKLRQPLVTLVEDSLRDDLADLRSMVARDYAAILTGVGDARKFHHMKSENNVSLSDKDRKHFEMLYKMSSRVIWIALRKKCLILIEKELHRLLRTIGFSPIEHDYLKRHHYETTPEEERILRGKACQAEKMLLHRSPCIQELLFDTHDYRMLAIGVTDIDDRTDRQTYLEIAYTAPEELLQELDVCVGLLGVQRKFLDPMLNEELSATRKRSSVLKPISDFSLPPFIQYDENKIYDSLPKRPCRYRESEVSANARRDQCKLWTEYVKRQGQYFTAPFITEKISTPSYSTIRSMTKSTSASSKEKKSEDAMREMGRQEAHRA